MTAIRGAKGVSDRRAYPRRRRRVPAGGLSLPGLSRPVTAPAFVRPAYRRRARRRRRLLRWAAIAAALIVIALLVVRAWTRPGSVVVLAAREMPSVAVHQYQEDPAWSGDEMGSTGKTLGKHGDGVACLASLIEMQGLPSPVSGELTPGTLNAWLSESDAYDGDGSIRWEKVADLLGARVVQVSPKRGMDALLEQLIQAEIYPIVTVRRPDTGAAHDVLAVGSVHGEFIVMDPLDPMEVLDTLGLYENRVYAMRYFE